jgi:hypothetical protein
VYAFTWDAADCQVRATLSNLTMDLDLFLLSACDPVAANLGASSTPLDLQTVEALTWTNVANQTYYVVVDGYTGAQGSYTLDVACTCK